MVYDLRADEHLEIIYSFMIGLLEAGMQNAPSSTPSGDSVQGSRESGAHDHEVGGEIFEKRTEKRGIMTIEEAKAMGILVEKRE